VNQIFFTRGFLDPVPVIITGLFAFAKKLAAASTASTCGAGGYGGGELIEPQEMSFGLMGEKRTSIGKSRRTGPGNTFSIPVLPRNCHAYLVLQNERLEEHEIQAVGILQAQRHDEQIYTLDERLQLDQLIPEENCFPCHELEEMMLYRELDFDHHMLWPSREAH